MGGCTYSSYVVLLQQIFNSLVRIYFVVYLGIMRCLLKSQQSSIYVFYIHSYTKEFLTGCKKSGNFISDLDIKGCASVL